MNKKIGIYSALTVLILGIIWFFYYFITLPAQGVHVQPSADFKPYIKGYTGGVISKEGSIIVELSTDIATQTDIETPIEKKLFDFSPSIKGKTVWLNAHTIEFIPENPLPSQQKYTASFYLSKLMKVAEQLGDFKFSFETARQFLDVQFTGLEYEDASDLANVKIKGAVVTSDVSENSAVEKMIKFSGASYSAVKWHHKDARTHHFTIEGVKRTSTTQTLVGQYNGKLIGSEQAEQLSYTIPAFGDFSVMQAQAVNAAEQYVEVVFSEPLTNRQNLEGLFTLNEVPDLQILVEGNVVKLYPPVRQNQSKRLIISEAVKNAFGKSLPKHYTFDIDFQEPKPYLQWAGKGEIIPSTNGFLIPFEAVGLKALDVKIIKIYANNVLPFFQTNRFGQNYEASELYRVGRLIAHKTIPIFNEKVSDYHKTKRYHIDLKNILQAEPGAIYQVELRYKKDYALYSCQGTSPNYAPVLMKDYPLPQPAMGYEYEYYDEYSYGDDYDYYQRENPCNSAYYSAYNTTAKRLLFASDIGVIAKRGKSGDVYVSVNDLLTAKAIANASIQLFDYQNQLMASGTTDDKGWFKTQLTHAPFLVVAKKDQHIAYLRMDEAEALPLTAFDVSGKALQNGLKGFLYGERGVWRPGDSLHVCFMLNDTELKLPANHPVIIELENPMGQTIKQTVLSQSVNGIYKTTLHTPPDAPTGRWSIKAKVGNAVFTMPAKIETVMPNRLKMELSLPENSLINADKPLKAQIYAQWLHGAKASQLPVEATLYLNNTETRFKNYPDYVFADITKSSTYEPVEILNGKLNFDGVAFFSHSLELNKNALSGFLKATVMVKVSEESGAFSTDYFSYTLSPFNAYVGIKPPSDGNSPKILVTDETHHLPIVCVDKEGNPLNRTIEVKMYRLDWRWWYDNADYEFTYFDDTYLQTVQTSTLKTQQGKAQFSFKINYPDWGRYLIKATDKQSGHSTSTIVYVDWPGYGATSTQAQNAGILRLTCDKEKYKVGDKARIFVPASENSEILVSLENGSNVLQSFRVAAAKGQTTVEIPITESMAPNVYAHIALLQPHAQTVNDLPIRLYGIVPLQVENPNAIISPMIYTAKSYRPLEKIKIEVRETQGKPMAYTLAIVDEGLLSLTRFKTPSPYNYFYAKEAIGVHTWDMYEYVLAAQTGEIKNVASIGGDAEIKGDEKNKVNRFAPVVKFLGSFQIGKNQSKTHEFTMPNYVGAVRVMVVAKSVNAFGNAEVTVPVTQPLMVLATLPRTLAPNDEIFMPINVFVMDKTLKNVNIKVQALQEVMVDGIPNYTINLNESDNKTIYVKLKVKDTEGTAKIKITATSGSESSTQIVEVPVINPFPHQTITLEKLLQPNETWTAPIKPFGVKGSHSATLEVSQMANLSLENRLQYLIQYPYGCLEQTISAVFPQMLAANIINTPQEEKQKVELNVKLAITKLASFQTSSGAFSYWPGQAQPDEWVTCYAGHFLYEASQRGYNVSSSILNHWLKFQNQMAHKWQPSVNDATGKDLLQAYRLYTLALAGNPNFGAMNRLREHKNASVSAKWRLAAAYALAGQKEVAIDMVKNLTTNIEYSQKQIPHSVHYGSAIRDKAMIAEVLALLNDQRLLTAMQDITTALASQTYYSTQETAFMIVAVAKAIQTFGSGGKLAFDYIINGAKPIKAVTDMATAKINIPTKEIENTSAASVSIKNTGKNVQYIRVYITGKSIREREASYENYINLQVRFVSTNGRAVDIEQLTQGTTFMAEVTVSNPGILGHYKNLALKQIFPAGWEINTTRTIENIYEVSADAFDYQDIRDDRVYTYFDLAPNTSKTFRIKLTAAYLGKYYLPATVVEAMYHHQVKAAQAGAMVEVIAPLSNKPKDYNN